MGESACLLRSFSHPSDASREVREGDPIRALTESVSFGRFMSDSLAWEKFSAFSHNRYLEEVEKFAKPGSVAQKKAYFEAHYRKKAALREASRIEEQGSGADVENPAAESGEPENPVKCDERQEEDSLNTAGDVSIGSADVPPEESKSENADVTSSGSLEQDPSVEDLSQDDDSTQMSNPDECIEIRTSVSEAAAKLEAADPHASTSTPTGGKERVISSLKLPSRSKPSLLPLPRTKGVKPEEQRNRNDTVPNREKPVVEKKKSASKSLPMSISFASSNVTTSKTLSPVLQQIRKLKDITPSLKLQGDTLISRKLPARASVNVKSKTTSLTQELEERRTKTLLNKSVAGRLMTDKSSSSLSKENSKLPFANCSRGQSPVVFSPFRFRSEERAAKRKEKQEEKVNAKDAENVKQRERYRFPNSKPQSLGKKAAQGTGLETKPRPPRKTSSKVVPAGHLKGKINPMARASVTSSLSRNNVRENSSPNIPR